MVYSFGVSEWKMGCFKDFGHPDDIFACRSVVNRFISWTLSSLGIVGFWGVPVDEGVVVMKQIESAAEAVYIDINERKLYSIDGERKIDSRFSILRLDSGLKDKNIRMTPEQMMSFLFHHCTFLDYSGPSTPVRQVIQYLSKNIEGQIFPKESFRPRSDLSL